MNCISRIWVSVGLVALWTQQALAVPANPTPVSVQVDGVERRMVLRGDERLNWYEDEDGAHWQHTESGWIRQSRAVRERDLPLPVEPYAASQAVGATTQRVVKNLVILVNFPDLKIPENDSTYSRTAFSNMLNQIGGQPGGNAGSVREYWLQATGDQVLVQSFLAGPVTTNFSYKYYSNGLEPIMVQEVLSKIKNDVYFALFDGDGDGWVDMLTIIHAGGGAEYGGNDPNYIWSHSSRTLYPITYDGVKLQNYITVPARRGWDSDPDSWGITALGVLVHEMGHAFGLPDLYDTTYNSSGAGDFCLMANGFWANLGLCPSLPSAWCRYNRGWGSTTTVSVPALRQLAPAATSVQSVRIKGKLPGSEYYLIENRQPVGFDAWLTGRRYGLLIWHIDDNVANNNNPQRYKVDLVEPGATQHLELGWGDGDDYDYWRRGHADAFTLTSVPSIRGYTGVDPGLYVVNISPSGEMMSFNIVDTAARRDITGQLHLGEWLGLMPAPLPVSVRDDAQNALEQLHLWLEPDGSYRVSLRDGAVNLYVRYLHWLGLEIPLQSGPQAVQIGLVNGDADGDNTISLFDFLTLDSLFGTQDPMADLDGDGTVTLFDYMVIDSAFGARGH